MKNPILLTDVFAKSTLNQQVFDNTQKAFELFRSKTKEIADEFIEYGKTIKSKEEFEFKNRGDLEFEISFSGDILMFFMHTNVFEFPRMHELMKTPYIKEDPTRSFCGMINIYNFLKDSFQYNRENDLGYLIGRIFINKENHYFLEGKKEIGLLYNNFSTSIISDDSVRDIIESAISYTVHFDLLTPPYEEVKLVTVSEMKASIDYKQLITGKRLGFMFKEDKE